MLCLYFSTLRKHTILPGNMAFPKTYHLGLRGRMPLFIKDFLMDRIFRVRLGTVMSELHNQEMGVLQGSILSVTLFILKINSITKVANIGMDKSLFVDDFSVSYSSPHMRVVERQMQNCLNKLQKWANENGFCFSKTKTVCVHFCNKRGLYPGPDLKLYDTLCLLFNRPSSWASYLTAS